MEYGKLKPSNREINSEWYPKSNQFTEKLKDTFKRNTGLNTVIEKNKVNDILDVFM